MIQDKTLDETLVELTRTLKALQALRKARKTSLALEWNYIDQVKEHAAAKRASLDLTRKLAQLRAGK